MQNDGIVAPDPYYGWPKSMETLEINIILTWECIFADICTLYGAIILIYSQGYIQVTGRTHLFSPTNQPLIPILLCNAISCCHKLCHSLSNCDLVLPYLRPVWRKTSSTELPRVVQIFYIHKDEPCTNYWMMPLKLATDKDSRWIFQVFQYQ